MSDLREQVEAQGRQIVRLDTLVEVLADDYKTRAPQAQVDRIEAVQHGHTADIATLKTMAQNDGPSWSWLNPFSWWTRASEPGAARAVKVFTRLVLLALLVFIVFKVVSYFDRAQDTRERAATAQETQAEKPPAQILILPADTTR